MIDIEKMAWSLPGISDERGNLRWIEGGATIPFEIRRVFYMADVPYMAMRGGHAHIAAHQFIVSLVGGFDVVLDDGSSQKQTRLNHLGVGLYVPPMTWCEITRFDHGSICLVLTSEHYNEADYIRDRTMFLEKVKQ